MKVEQKYKSYQARRVLTRARNTTQSKWNNFSNSNLFFGDQPQRAVRIGSWKIKLLFLSEWKKLHSYQVTKEEMKTFLGINFVVVNSNDCRILDSR